MIPTPATARVLLVRVLSATALLTAVACSADGREPAPVPSVPVRASSATAAPAVEQPTSAPVPPALDEEQVRSALVTQADLGDPWVPTRGAATWRDGVLKATARDADCRWLLEALYTEEVFGAPAGPRAVVALDDPVHEGQLRHQVATHRPADADRVLERLGALAGTCGRFTATAEGSGAQEVAVEELPLPEAGDARAALRVTLTGTADDGAPTRLTVDVAAVRVGGNTVTLTHGGLGEVSPEVTQAAVRLGAERLSEVGRRARARV